MQSRDFEQIVEAIANAMSLADLSVLIEELARAYGLAHIVYHAVRIPAVQQENPILLLTYDPAWVRRYKEREYFQIDPVVASGTKGFLPLDWSAVDRESLDARRFFAEAESYGVGRHGVTIPIRGLAGEKALFTVTSHACDRDWIKQRVAYVRDFHVIAHFIHDRVIRISGWRPTQGVRNLSRREQECLQLVACGKQPKVVAEILQLSESAVRLYMTSARHKLSCLTTNQAIAKSVGLEMINI